MLRSYFTIAVRQLLAQKLYTAINVAGLAMGLACAMLIALFVRHELSFDRQYPSSDRIVRISEDVALDRPIHTAGSSPAIAPLLAGFFPGVEGAARLSSCFDGGGGALITVGERQFVEPRLMVAENGFFEIFDFDWLRGDSRLALANPSTVVLTDSAARRYFGDADALGKTIEVFQMRLPHRVTGVISDLPDNTHLRFDLLLSMSALPAEALQGWGGDCFHTYARLSAGADPADITSRSHEFFNQRFREGSGQIRGFTAVPIHDIHLRSTREDELKSPGSIANVYTLAAIAAFVLLIACVNFVNLATARATQRAREVGLRKAVGGTRSQLLRQFLGESLLLAAVAVAVAIVIVVAALGPFAAFLERDIGYGDFARPEVVAAVVAIALLVAGGAGSYPAFLLSSFKPARALRGQLTRSATAATFRKGLVVLQFSISIALIVATLVMVQQRRFAESIDLGYETEQMVVFTGSQDAALGPQWGSMKRRLGSVPGVAAVTASSVVPGTRTGAATQVRHVDDDDGFGGFVAQLMLVDFGFLETYEIDVLAGRALSEASNDRETGQQPGEPAPPTPTSFVISRLAAERLGWTPAEAIGRLLNVSDRTGIIVGVVEDAYLESVRDPLVPVLYLVPPAERAAAQIREASIRVTGADLERTLAGIDEVWRELGPPVPVQRRFLDDDFKALYRGERRQAQLLTTFSALAVAIACLGLYGLASYSTTRRTKEIGIRKTLGASAPEIVRLFATEFGVLVLLANFIAWPVAYFATQRWLSGFAYRIELGPFVFVASAALVLAVALLTVAVVAAHAARVKPVATLRYE
jgi:putative ABC transport system permease protein